MEGQKKTLSLLSLIFGILAFVITFTPISMIAIAFPILGIIFSVIGKKKEGKNGLNKAGFILSLIALILWIILIVILGLLLGAMAIGMAALM